jgi:hypothetical protein
MNGAEVQLMSSQELKTLSVEIVKRITLSSLNGEMGQNGQNGIDRKLKISQYPTR